MSFPTDPVAQAIAEDFHKVSEDLTALEDAANRHQALGKRQALLIDTWKAYRHPDYPTMADGNAVFELDQVYAQRPEPES